MRYSRTLTLSRMNEALCRRNPCSRDPEEPLESRNGGWLPVVIRRSFGALLLSMTRKAIDPRTSSLNLRTLPAVAGESPDGPCQSCFDGTAAWEARYLPGNHPLSSNRHLLSFWNLLLLSETQDSTPSSSCPSWKRECAIRSRSCLLPYGVRGSESSWKEEARGCSS